MNMIFKGKIHFPFQFEFLFSHSEKEPECKSGSVRHNPTGKKRKKEKNGSSVLVA